MRQAIGTIQMPDVHFIPFKPLQSIRAICLTKHISTYFRNFLPNWFHHEKNREFHEAREMQIFFKTGRGGETKSKKIKAITFSFINKSPHRVLQIWA